MAKAPSFHSVYSGKLGANVYFRNKAGKARQGVRERVVEVANPKTYAQARQRMIMAAVQNFYGALKPIIDRGFETQAYGNPSRLRFLSLAMSADYKGAYVPKSTKVPVPCNVPITEGSLPSMTGSRGFNRFSYPVTNVVVPTQPANLGTIGDVSSLIISAGRAKAGDQITILFAIGYGSQAGQYNDFFVYRDISFIVDPADTTNMRTQLKMLPVVDTVTGGYQLGFDISDTNFLNSDEELQGYAIILSREGASGQHLRSSERLEINLGEEILSDMTKFYSTEAYEAAVASYMDGSKTTDWPQVPE